jgi:UDP-N-acetylglucosamine 2-epimerase
VDDPERLKVIFEAICTLGTVVMPIHPRLERRMSEFEILLPANVIPLEPVTYRESLTLQAWAKKVITDSGGVQKEAFYLGVPCSVLRSETEWVEINNLVAGTTVDSIIEGILAESFIPKDNPYYHGGASRQIAEVLSQL